MKSQIAASPPLLHCSTFYSLGAERAAAPVSELGGLAATPYTLNQWTHGKWVQ
ncbi:MAG TPA: hypothetical protein VMG59_12765 [Phycisphaerae bacterium]|nr:hypothetical protein [Phycisphaerae bacterium]